MSKVLVIDSTYETCGEAVEQAFAAFPVDVKGKKVAVKVNGLMAVDPDTFAHVTNYNVLKAVLQKLEKMNPKEIVVGDSVGPSAYGSSESVFEATKLKETAGPYYRNFNTNLVLVDLEWPFKRQVAVLKDVIDADVYISVPKMKTHGMTRITGAIKNNFGLLTGAQKAWYHYYSRTPEVFSELLIEMYRLRVPDLVIMDGVLAMEGYGPVTTERRWVNKILASNDGVALDTVMAKIIGYEVEEVPYLKIAKALNLGETDLEAMEIEGEFATIPDYHRPEPAVSSYSFKVGPEGNIGTIEPWRRRVAFRPAISSKVCQHPQGCMSCVDICPTGALTKGSDTPDLTSEKCLVCCACKEVCNFGGLEFEPEGEIVEDLIRQEGMA